MKWSTPYRGVSRLTVNEWTATVDDRKNFATLLMYCKGMKMSDWLNSTHATVDAAKKYAEERIEWFVRTDTARHYED